MKIKMNHFVITGVSFLLFLGFCYWLGIRVNTSPSIPVGVYILENKSIEKGEYVIWCPPPRSVFLTAKKRGYITGGFCPGNLGYIMKVVLGTPGDTIGVNKGGVFVNGSKVPFSAQRSTDPGGRPLPSLVLSRYVLSNSEYLLMSDTNPLSFDGRYFGPINRKQIRSVMRPLITW